jgi:hypothetical protein
MKLSTLAVILSISMLAGGCVTAVGKVPIGKTPPAPVVTKG